MQTRKRSLCIGEESQNRGFNCEVRDCEVRDDNHWTKHADYELLCIYIALSTQVLRYRGNPLPFSTTIHFNTSIFKMIN